MVRAFCAIALGFMMWACSDAPIFDSKPIERTFTGEEVVQYSESRAMTAIMSNPLFDEIIRRYRALPKDQPKYEKGDISDDEFNQWLVSGEMAWAMVIYGKNITRWKSGEPFTRENYHVDFGRILESELSDELKIQFCVYNLRNHR